MLCQIDELLCRPGLLSHSRDKNLTGRRRAWRPFCKCRYMRCDWRLPQMRYFPVCELSSRPHRCCSSPCLAPARPHLCVTPTRVAQNTWSSARIGLVTYHHTIAGHAKAYSFTVQIRSADEPATRSSIRYPPGNPVPESFHFPHTRTRAYVTKSCLALLGLPLCLRYCYCCLLLPFSQDTPEYISFIASSLHLLPCAPTPSARCLPLGQLLPVCKQGREPRLRMRPQLE